MYLEKINSPADVKKLSTEEMKKLAQEMRDALIFKLSRHGGHCGPNLGFAEATIALHYVFNSPTDKMVFDVSHQTYCHKMLTGRTNSNKVVVFGGPEDSIGQVIDLKIIFQ